MNNLVYFRGILALSMIVIVFLVCHPLVAVNNLVYLRKDRSDCGEFLSKIVSEYDQEIPQSQTADNPVAPRGRAAQPSRDNRKTN